MHGVWQIYKRFFGSLKLLLGVGLLLVAAESTAPYIVAALSRYTVDEVLEIDLQGANNEAVEVVCGPEDQANLEAGRVGRQRPMRVLQDEEKVGANPAVMVEVGADRLTVSGDASNGGAELKEALALKRGKNRAAKVRMLLLVFAATIGVYVLHGIFKVLHKYLLGKVGEVVVYRLRRSLHEKLQRLSMAYHDQHEKGRLMARVIDDTDVIRQMSISLSMTLTVNVCTVVIGAAVILLIDVKLALLAMLSMPLFAVVYRRYQVRLRTLWQQLARQRAGIYGLVGDRLASPETVKSFGQERRETIRLFRRARDLLSGEIQMEWLGGFLGLWRTLICGVSSAVVLGVGMLMVRDGTLSIGYLLFFYGSLAMMYQPVAAISMLVPAVQRFNVSAERVLEILDAPVSIQDAPGAISLPLVAGIVRMKNMWLQYEGSEEAALKDVNLTVEPGQRVCLMGPSGSGKTSLVNALLRLYEPTSGSVLLDGRDLREIKLSSLREHVAYVPQDAFLFSGTLRDNIRYGNFLADNKQVEGAARAAELHDFVLSLPKGYDTMVGERGVTLSGGQRQRVSLARALLTDPRVLVLDDCTSALDANTEARIIKTLGTALKGRTTIIITHRVSMSSRADVVIVLKEGMVAEVGSHEELLSKEGVYYDLVVEQLAESHLQAKSGRVMSAAG